MGELCDRINIGWTCCTLCCEVNTENKRILIQQKIEKNSLLRTYINLSLKETEPEVYNIMKLSSQRSYCCAHLGMRWHHLQIKSRGILIFADPNSYFGDFRTKRFTANCTLCCTTILLSQRSYFVVLRW